MGGIGSVRHNASCGCGGSGHTFLRAELEVKLQPFIVLHGSHQLSVAYHEAQLQYYFEEEKEKGNIEAKFSFFSLMKVLVFLDI